MNRERAALDITLKVFGWLLLATAVLPLDHYGPDPVWPWEGLQDAAWLEIPGVLLPLLASLACFALGFSRLSLASKSSLALISLLAGWAAAAVGAAVPHALLPFRGLAEGLPPLFDRGLWALLGGVVMLAAGIRLGAAGFLAPSQGLPAKADPWSCSRWLTGSGILAVVGFYLAPWRGEVPVASLVGRLFDVLRFERGSVALALAASQVLALGPLLLVLGCVGRCWRRAPDGGGMLPGMAVAYLPALCLLVGFRGFIDNPSLALERVRAAVVLLSVLVIGSLALAALVRDLAYSIPWAFGRLDAADQTMLAALSGAQPEKSWAGFVGSLPLPARLLFRRRMALWRSAIGAEQGPALIEIKAELERRRTEEGESGKPDPPRRTWWMRRWVVSLAGPLLGVVAAGSWWALPGPAGPASCPEPIQVSASLDRLFGEALPAVLSEMSSRAGRLETLPSFASFASELDAAEQQFPGLRRPLLSLLELGRQGRSRLHAARRARDELNRFLGNNGIPLYLRSRMRSRDSELGDLFYVLCYHVQECRRYERVGSGQRFPVLLLSRADDLNIVEGFLGASDEAEAVVTILTDRLEEFLADELLPRARREDPLGQALRTGLLAGQEEQPLDGDPELEPLQASLLEGLVRHELHHRWLGLEPEPPAPLWRWMGHTTPEAMRAVAAEVGALLGELGYRPGYARLRFALMLESLDSEAGFTGVHGVAARFLLVSLFDVQADSFPLWRLTGADLVLAALASFDDAVLGEAVRRLHRELFGLELPRFERIH